MQRTRSIRIYVRNKNRYNPETKEKNFLFVDIEDFAGTTIGEIKENVRRQCKGAVRIDELFLDNKPLADDRSVAHYSLADGTILETTSNPFWVACLYIKASEVKQEQEGNPSNEEIQKWTQKSIPKKYVLIGLLLNSKSEYVRQPPHFATMDEFVVYLQRLDKKGATMHPEYTQKDLRGFEREYRDEFIGRYTDPLAAFIDFHAVRLGYALPEEIDQRPLTGHQQPMPVQHRAVGSMGTGGDNIARNSAAGQPKNASKRGKQVRYCDDCEEAVAEVYCGECQGGLAMCRRCSGLLHSGASRRRHNIQDIEQAPNNSSKPYVPRAFLAPFSIILAMFSEMAQGRLSLMEDEIKRIAQPLTDTDLQDKQAGKYVGGFDCMENMLMNKGLVKKEAARIPTYALTASGQLLGERLHTFYIHFYRFLQSCGLPKVHSGARSFVIGNRKLCLIIDDNERDKARLLQYATEKNIDAQVRLLPAGDYIWILTPPMVDTNAKYIGTDSGNEMVLPYVVERKSWEDFENSVNSGRYQRQVNNMLGCGLSSCFYLMEGNMSGMRSNPTHQQQQYLKGLLEKLTVEKGFYVNYTSSWMKSAQWLLWLTGLLLEQLQAGKLQDNCISYQAYLSRVARQRGQGVCNEVFRNSRKQSQVWRAQHFVDNIFRDSQQEQKMLTTVQIEMGPVQRDLKHLLVIQDLEQYNKKRQSALTKCCEAVHANPDQARDTIEEKLGPSIHNMVHYDVMSYWQLYIQVVAGVYVVRTENAGDTEKIQRLFTGASGPGPGPEMTSNQSRHDLHRVPKRRAPKSRKAATATVTSKQGQGHWENNLHFEELGQAQRDHLPLSELNSDNLSRRNEFPFDHRHTPMYCDTNSGENGRLSTHGVLLRRSDSLEIHGQNDVLPSHRSNLNGHGIIHRRGGVGKSLPFGKAMPSPFHTDDSLTVDSVAGQSHTGTVRNRVLEPGNKSVHLAKGETAEDFLISGNCISGHVIKRPKRNSASRELESSRESVYPADVEPFSGQGYCLGSRSPSRSDNSPNITEHSNKVNVFDLKQSDPGLTGGMWSKKTHSANIGEKLLEYSVSGDSHGATSPEGENQSFTPTDYVNSQDENEVMAKVLALSAEETTDVTDEDCQTKMALKISKESAAIAAVTASSNEDEMVALAMELSKQTSQVNETGRKGVKDDSGNLQLAIALSKASCVEDNVGENIDNDEDLKRAIELSKLDEQGLKSVSHPETLRCSVEKNTESVKQGNLNRSLDSLDKGRVTSHESVDPDSQDEALQIAIELSKAEKESVNAGCIEQNDSFKTDSEVIVLDSNSQNYEEFSSNNPADGNRNNSAGQRFLKRKLEPICEKELKENLHEKLLEEEQVELAVRLSLTHSEKISTAGKTFSGLEDVNRSKKLKLNDLKIKPSEEVGNSEPELDENRQDLSGLSQKVDEMAQLQIAIERSKVEHSPLKKVKIGTKLVDEEEMLRIVIERSKLENRIVKVDEKCNEVFDVIEINSQDSQENENICSPRIDFGEENESVCNPKLDVGDDKDKADGFVGHEYTSEVIKGGETAYKNCSKSVDREESAEDELIPPSPVKSQFSFSCSPITSTPILSSSKELNKNTECGVKGADSRETDEISDRYTPEIDITKDISAVKFSDKYFMQKHMKGDDTDKSDFDIRRSLFYDSDSDSEGEQDFFDGREVKPEASAGRTSREQEHVIANADIKQENLVKDSHINSSCLQASKTERNKSCDAGLERMEKFSVVKKFENNKLIDCQDCDNDSNISLGKVSSRKDDAEEIEAADTEDVEPADKIFDYEDDDNDLDYQPSTQDINMDTESDSDEGDTEASSQRSDAEHLPLIRRPRKWRYKQLKEESEIFLQQKRIEMETQRNKVKIKMEKEEVSVDQDEMYARQLQVELNKEVKELERSKALVDDEYIARQLHELINKEPPPDTQSETVTRDRRSMERNHEADSRTSVSNNQGLVTPDTQSVSRERNHKFDLRNLVLDNQGLVALDTDDKMEEENGRIANNCCNRKQGRGRVNDGGHKESLVRELQRRELEKIERWRKMLEEDEKLAKRLQDMQDTEKKEEEDVQGIQTTLPRNLKDPDVELSFRQVVAQHKASKEKALAQLQEYRKLQMQRFQESHSSGSLAVNRGNQLLENDVVVLDDLTTVKERTQGTSATRPSVPSSASGIQGSNTSDHSGYMQTDTPNALIHTPTTHAAATHIANLDSFSSGALDTDRYLKPHIKPSHSLHHFEADFFGTIQSQASGTVQSPASDSDSISQTSQSQLSAVKNSNIKCGNCGEKGHNRTYAKCPKYHTAEESARRQAKQDKIKQQREEKQKQEVETINMLTEHRRVLEEMTTQIQREMGTIQNRLQRRATELESQVNSRVQKIENANKKRKR